MTFLVSIRPSRRRATLRGCGGAALLAVAAICAAPARGYDRLAYLTVLNETRPPIGWVDFCN